MVSKQHNTAQAQVIVTDTIVGLAGGGGGGRGCR